MACACCNFGRKFFRAVFCCVFLRMFWRSIDYDYVFCVLIAQSLLINRGGVLPLLCTTYTRYSRMTFVFDL